MQAALSVVLPLACAWAEKQESTILQEGVALSAALLEDAKKLGLVHPERVRLRAVEKIPLPLHPVLRRMAEQTGLISPLTAGMTLRYGIFIRSDCWGDRRLAVHELAHVAQYERLGGFRPFLKLYLGECIKHGYPFGPMEQEAKRAEQEICG
ncbi:MAG TPA: hypothetical protein VN578_17895 [Candidatus Binatia bacterium]|jgi:hypothetical protein|nr:hypothetical protein [Candidatus Binatia bacterium]